MKNRKREKKKWASQPAARPKLASPASPIAAASQRVRSSSRPAQLVCNSPARGPARRPHPRALLPSPAAAATWPHASATRCPRPRVSPSHLQPLPRDPACQPSCSFSPHRAQPPRDQEPTVVVGAGQGSCPGHGPVSPLAHRPRDLCANHPTLQCRSMPTVHHQPSAYPPKMELRVPAIKLGPRLP